MDTASSGTHILSSDHVHPEKGGVDLPDGTTVFERGQPKETPSSVSFGSTSGDFTVLVLFIHYYTQILRALKVT